MVVWSVEGGDDGELLMAARKTAPTVAVCQTEQIEKIPPPPPPPTHFIFIFVFLFIYLFFCYFFAMFCVDMGHFLIFFCIFFMFTNFEIQDIKKRRRKRNLLIGQPQGSLSESIDTLFICFDLKLLFLVACLLED